MEDLTANPSLFGKLLNSENTQELFLTLLLKNKFEDLRKFLITEISNPPIKRLRTICFYLLGANAYYLGMLANSFEAVNQIEIKFIDPDTRNIKETSEEFISIFLRGALIPIKEKYPEMKLDYFHFKDSNIIEKIQISNITSINDYDLITSKIRELLFVIKSEK